MYSVVPGETDFYPFHPRKPLPPPMPICHWENGFLLSFFNFKIASVSLLYIKSVLSFPPEMESLTSFFHPVIKIIQACF